MPLKQTFGGKMSQHQQNIDEKNLLTCNLWKHFSNLQDPRVKDNQKYAFQQLITAIVCAVICGSNDVESITNYIESKIDWFRERLGMEVSPSYSTIWWLLVLINPEELHRSFASFVQEVRSALCPQLQTREEEPVAIDGKTNRGTSREGVKALHMVSAWSSSLQLLLGQVKTDEKSNEVTAIPELLGLLDLKGKVITIDAMGCQASIAEQIVNEGGHYILALKGNQETMHEGVKEIFNQIENKKNEDHPRFIVDEASEWDKGHGRMEERRIRVSQEVNWLKKGKKWATVNSLIEITGTRVLAGQTTAEKRYYLSDMRTEAKKFLKWIRSH